MIRIAILDLYEGQPNQGMRCLRTIISEWSDYHKIPVTLDEFEVRLLNQVPDTSYDVYISSGGPGSPLESIGSAWEEVYFSWLKSIEEYNDNPANHIKKSIFFICHSFELACRHYGVGEISKRKSTAFGVFPVHVLPAGQVDPLFNGLNDPFYVVDSRDWQVVHPDLELMQEKGMLVLCIEKYRPHVPYSQAVMGVRFNEYFAGTQFHPEADAKGMSLYLQSEEKKKLVIEQHGEAKWHSMMEGLTDPDKIMRTYGYIIPNFLDLAVKYAMNSQEA